MVVHHPGFLVCVNSQEVDLLNVLKPSSIWSGFGQKGREREAFFLGMTRLSYSSRAAGGGILLNNLICRGLHGDGSLGGIITHFNFRQGFVPGNS